MKKYIKALVAPTVPLAANTLDTEPILVIVTAPGVPIVPAVVPVLGVPPVVIIFRQIYGLACVYPDTFKFPVILKLPPMLVSLATNNPTLPAAIVAPK